jgi:hypothetical protein
MNMKSKIPTELQHPGTYGTWVAMVIQQGDPIGAKLWLEEFTEGYVALLADVGIDIEA